MIADLQQQLGIDSSFFGQFIIFVAIYFWLRIVFFAPFLRLILKREGQSEGLSETAEKLEEESASLEAQYQEALSGVRKRAFTEREGVLNGARKQGTELIAQARGQAKAKLEQARDASARLAETELASLKPQASPISALLVNKLMNNKVGL